MRSKIILLAAMLFLASCAKRITVSCGPAVANSGTVKLLPTQPTVRTTVIMNDSLIVEKRRVKSVTIKNVPKGSHEISYSADNSSYKYPLDTTMTVNVDASKEVTRIVKVPPYSTGYYISVCLPLLAAVLILIFL